MIVRYFPYKFEMGLYAEFETFTSTKKLSVSSVCQRFGFDPRIYFASDDFYEKTHKKELINLLIYSFLKNIYNILPRRQYHRHHH